MKTKFGSIITDGRGKIGGHVASKNRAGSYLRTKVTPVNPGSPYQAEVRNRFGTLATAWGALTAAQRTAWNDAVGNFKSTDIFGDLKTPTGFNLFQRLNNNLLQIGVAQINLPPLPAAVAEIKTGVLAAATAGAITVTFVEDPVVVNCDMVVDASPALSPGKSFVKSELRRIGKAPAIVAHVLTLTGLYGTKFGAVGAAGEKIFVRLKMVNKTTGQAGIPVVYSVVISA